MALASSGASEEVPVRHFLPFPAGVTYCVSQGNDQGPTHNDVWNKYAFDFSPMAIGSDVCASADGTVVFVKGDCDGPTGKPADNNEIAILHADGRVSTYLHLMKDGVLVELNQVVHAGMVIGKSGNTGSSDGPHLHFCVREKGRLGPSVPIRFADVPGTGIPKKGDLVTSANVTARPIRDAFEDLEARYRWCDAVEGLVVVAGEFEALMKPEVPAAFAILMPASTGRDTFVAVFQKGRDSALARYRADANARLEHIERLRAEGNLVEAVRLATFAIEDFAPLEEKSAFQTALGAMRDDPGYRSASAAAKPRIAWRRDLTRALALKERTVRKAEAGKRVRWDSVIRTFERLQQRAPTPEIAAALEPRLDELRARASARAEAPEARAGQK